MVEHSNAHSRWTRIADFRFAVPQFRGSAVVVSDYTKGVTGINGGRSQIEQGSIAVIFRYVLGDFRLAVRPKGTEGTDRCG